MEEEEEDNNKKVHNYLGFDCPHVQTTTLILAVSVGSSTEQ